MRIKQIAKTIGFPCVVKPPDSERGRGITSNINTLSQLKKAIILARKSTPKKYILIQEYIPGSDYRLNITAGVLNFVVKRSAPTVIGNGVDSLYDLIQRLNASRRSRKLVDNLSSEVDINDIEVQNCISSSGLNINSVVDDGCTISLRTNSNVSTGGLREEITPADVHPRIISQCLSIAKTFRLDCCGIDYITTDISLDPLHHPGAFIEVNYMPEHQPQRAKELINNLFPPESLFSIPCTLIIDHWDKIPDKTAIHCLQSLLSDKPSATFACPSSLKLSLLSFLSEQDYCNCNFFDHPAQLIVDKSISELICLITPELLVRRGWMQPVNRLTIFNFVTSDGSPTSEALLRYLDRSPNVS